MKLFVAAFVSAVVVAATIASAQSHTAVVANVQEAQWGPAPPFLPPGAQIAVLSGDPAAAGLFTIRIKFPAGYVVAPHHHPADELVTVVEGSIDLGMGDTFDKNKTKRLNTGGYAVAAKGMNHYVTTASGGIVQVSAEGPFAIIYANPKDDPRNAGK